MNRVLNLVASLVLGSLVVFAASPTDPLVTGGSNRLIAKPEGGKVREVKVTAYGRNFNLHGQAVDSTEVDPADGLVISNVTVSNTVIVATIKVDSDAAEDAWHSLKVEFKDGTEVVVPKLFFTASQATIDRREIDRTASMPPVQVFNTDGGARAAAAAAAQKGQNALEVATQARVMALGLESNLNQLRDGLLNSKTGVLPEMTKKINNVAAAVNSIDSTKEFDPTRLTDAQVNALADELERRGQLATKTQVRNAIGKSEERTNARIDETNKRVNAVDAKVAAIHSALANARGFGSGAVKKALKGIESGETTHSVQ